VQAGILEDRPPDSGVRAAVLSAPELTERQKQVLLEIYDSFRREAAAQLPDDAGDDAVTVEVAAIQAAAAARQDTEAARAQDAAGGAWEQVTGPASTGLDEEDDDPLAAVEPLGTTGAATPPDSAGLPDGRTRKEERP
jgi:hypothetical protein